MIKPSDRRDVVAVGGGVNYACYVLCLNCGHVRGAWTAELLPEPGICSRCAAQVQKGGHRDDQD